MAGHTSCFLPKEKNKVLLKLWLRFPVEGGTGSCCCNVVLVCCASRPLGLMRTVVCYLKKFTFQIVMVSHVFLFLFYRSLF